jgi:hypothetical protein
VIVGVPVAETVHVAALVPHKTQLGEPVAGVCKPYPEEQVVIVTVPLAATVHVAALAPHETQLGEPDAGVCKPYPVWQPEAVRLTVIAPLAQVEAYAGQAIQPTGTFAET